MRFDHLPADLIDSQPRAMAARRAHWLACLIAHLAYIHLLRLWCQT